MKGYYTSKRCAQCGTTDYYALTKTEAAFSRYEYIIEIACSKCQSLTFDMLHATSPDIDKKLLDMWGVDVNLHFYEQDEEVILAEISNMDLFLDAIDNSDYLPLKKNVLLSALCIVYYDHAANSHEYTEKENTARKISADTVLPELMKRKGLVKNIPDWQLGDYIIDMVYPAIGLPIK